MRTLIKDIVNKSGEEVELKGWVASRRDHGKIIFIDLIDGSQELVQIVFTPKNESLYKQADELRDEWVVRIVGEVKERPDNMKNSDIATGDYEISATELEVLSRSDTPPIAVQGDGRDIGEESRMKYRYLDLRRKRMQTNLRMRHKVFKFFIDKLTEGGFVDVETPILGKSTPEGARDFLVPSRKEPGKFYALPQSPQQYKQLLMVAGLEKYFQIVKCFRDEDTRGDRQSEFTQLDIEMSFVSQDDVMTLVEKLILQMVGALYPDKKLKLDKSGGIPKMTYAEAMDKHDTDRPDLRDNKDDENELAFLFVTDFPAFEYKEGDKKWGAMHHPFTMPQVEDAEGLKKMFKKDPGSILANQYDLVLNGYEIAGGSIRIHQPELLSAVFELLDHSKEEIEEKFGHLLKAFKFGVPPHGGIALGLDRLMAVLQNEPNIREVIAFPKTGDGRDLLMGAPSDVDKQQLKELHIKIDKK